MNYAQLKNYEFTFGQYNGRKIKNIIDLSEYTPENWAVVVRFAEYLVWCDENVGWYNDAEMIIDAINERGDKLLKKLEKEFGKDWRDYIDCDASEFDLY